MHGCGERVIRRQHNFRHFTLPKYRRARNRTCNDVWNFVRCSRATLLFKRRTESTAFSLVSELYFGEEKLVIVTIGVNLLMLLMAIYTSPVDCLQPMVCQYHAENNLHSKIKTIRLGVKASIAINLILTFAGMIFVGFMPEMFGVKDQKLIDEATEAMRCFLPFIIFLVAH